VGLTGCAADEPAATEPSASDPVESETSSDEVAPSRTTLVVPEPTVAVKCAVVSPELLAKQDLAFDGVVTSIEDDVATLEVTTWYAGDETDVVQVSAPSSDLTELIGAVSFEEGQRFLVAGTAERLAPCGMSAPYSTELAEMYEEAFGA
jgi:hypothetical protein